jgi:hypothetical protein
VGPILHCLRGKDFPDTATLLSHQKVVAPQAIYDVESDHSSEIAVASHPLLWEDVQLQGSRRCLVLGPELGGATLPMDKDWQKAEVTGRRDKEASKEEGKGEIGKSRNRVARH